MCDFILYVQKIYGDLLFYRLRAFVGWQGEGVMHEDVFSKRNQ
jgi:hypothetical protein